MNVTIFGATGNVGLELVKQSLFKGYKTKAFGRNVFTTDFPKDKNLELVQGALFDKDQALKAIKGADAVLSAIGGGTDSNDKTRSLGMKNIIEQMQKAGVKRIIAVGNASILNKDEDSLVIDDPDFPTEYLAVGKEHLKAFEYLKASSLDWTFVCCPDIIHEGPTGVFATKVNYLPTPNNNRINAGDIALFMISELSKNEYVKQRVGISN